MTQKNCIKIIKKFYSVFEYYNSEEFHETCVRKILQTLNYEDTFVPPHDESSTLRNLYNEMHGYIVKNLQNYNTFEILKEIMIYNDLIKFKEYIISDDIQNTIYYFISILSEALPAKKTRTIDLLTLQTTIQYIFILSLLDRNSSICKYIDSTYKLFDYCNEPIKQEEFDAFFEEYQKMNKFDKPEDPDGLTPETLKHLKNIFLLPEQINTNTLDKADFGFSYNDFLNFEKEINKLDPLKLYSGTNEYFSSLLNNIDYIPLVKLLNFFSFENNCCYDYLQVELHPIYKHDNRYYLTCMVTQQATTMFRHLISSEHFIEYYGVQEKSIFKTAENQITQFFSFKIADILRQKSYVIPLDENGNIMVDLIIREPSLSKEINDVDVLSLDPCKKIIYNIELKYYKPVLHYQDLFKDTFSEKHVKKIIDRGRQLNSIKQYLLKKYFNISSSGNDYEIKNILITSRPKYKSVYNQNPAIKMISYFTFNEKLSEGKNPFD